MLHIIVWNVMCDLRMAILIKTVIKELLIQLQEEVETTW